MTLFSASFCSHNLNPALNKRIQQVLKKQTNKKQKENPLFLKNVHKGCKQESKCPFCSYSTNQRKHMIFILLGMAHFTECNGFPFHPFCCKNNEKNRVSFFVYSWVAVNSVYIHLSTYLILTICLALCYIKQCYDTTLIKYLLCVCPLEIYHAWKYSYFRDKGSKYFQNDSSLNTNISL